jgi:hypothetical protein
MRRTPAKSRKYLKDAALIAMDDRIAAEILLRFYEDFALRGKAEPLPDLSGAMGWHPLHERLSSDDERRNSTFEKSIFRCSKQEIEQESNSGPLTGSGPQLAQNPPPAVHKPLATARKSRCHHPMTPALTCGNRVAGVGFEPT